MFLQADLDLTTRDTVLPGLRLLLDPDAFRDALQRALPGHPIGDATFQYVRYKPGTNGLSAFTFDLNGSPVRGYVKAYHAADTDKLAKAEERRTVAGPDGLGRLVLADHATEVVFFPNDNKLKRLGKLFDDESRTEVFDRVFADRPDLRSGSLHLLRYKPERRFVGRVDRDGTPEAALKLYDKRSYPDALAAAQAFGPDAGLLGRSDRDGVLAFCWRHGTPLADVVAGPSPSLATIEQVGAALAAFHCRSVDGLRVRERAAERATIDATARFVEFLHPALTGLIDTLTRELKAELQDAPSVLQPIHGDFYERQVIVEGNEIVILDLDEAVLSDPAADLGLFIAHLERDALSRGLDPASVEPIRAALLNGYGLLPARVDTYTAFGLLQLAPHHFRNREPDWPERTQATVERALTIATRTTAGVR